MIRRVVLVLLLTLLALAGTQSVYASTHVSALSTVFLAAKHHHHHHKHQQPTFQTVRQSVTQIFSNPKVIVIPGIGNSSSPYPSTINASGLTNGVITDVNLTLINFGHGHPSDVDVMVVSSQLPGQNVMVMSDVGLGGSVSNVSLTLDDQAGEHLPAMNGVLLTTGTFRPTNAGAMLDPFPLFQTPSGNSALSVFNGSNPNGTWALYVVDDYPPLDDGQIAGWSLTITADVDQQVVIPATPGKHHHKHHKHK